MVACFLSMEEVPGSIPGKSIILFYLISSNGPKKELKAEIVLVCVFRSSTASKSAHMVADKFLLKFISVYGSQNATARHNIELIETRHCSYYRPRARDDA